MKNKNLAFIFAAQFIIIALMFVSAFLPVFLGKEVRLLASGFDPRDLLAGHYVRLNYNLNLKADRYMDGKEKFYVSLKQGENGIYTFDKLYENEKPKEGLFIEAKRTYGLNLELKHIDKYFATKERALELEKRLLSEKIIVVARVLNGKARIVGLEAVK